MSSFLEKNFKIIFLLLFLFLKQSVVPACTNNNCDKSDSYEIKRNLTLRNYEENILLWNDSSLSINWAYLAQNKSTFKINYFKSNFSENYVIPEFNDEKRKIAYENVLLKKVASQLLNLQPVFDPSFASSSSSMCKAQTKIFLKSLENLDLWALQMYDASAKIPSGILNGNVNQFGDFDQCVNVQGMDAIQGKYCLAYLQPVVPDNLMRLKHISRLAQSHSAFRSNFDDPGHRVPRFSTINWALCVPSACSNLDVEISLKDYLRNFTSETSIQFKVQVDPEMCQLKSHFVMDRDTKIAGGFFLLIITISILSTIYEARHRNKTPLYSAFSLYKNSKALFSLERDANDIKSVHGIRFLNAIMLIVSHKSMALFFNPYINRTGMSELLGKPWTVIGRAASLYTDPFIMLSGLLTAYSLFGRLQRGQPIRIFQEYVGRLFRIVPTLGALILFCTYILPLLGSGPQWNLVVTHHSDICKTYWWRNLMFIHNYFGFENMCLTHTHHIGIDTQLFLTAPILVLLIWKWPRKGVMSILAIAGLSTIARYYVTMTKRLSNYVYFGTSVSQLFDTANFMYILPAHRITVYIMGILLGYVLRTYKDLKLTKTQLKIGWSVNTALVLAAFFGPAPMGSINYIYDPTHAAAYAAFAPIAWCSFFAWVIFTSHLGYRTLVSRLFSWRRYQVTTRLSYAIYLTQFPVFFYNVGRTRSAEFYEFIRMTVNFNELFWITLTSIILTLFFDSPFQNIKKIIFKTPTKVKTKSTEELSEKQIIYEKEIIKDLKA